MNNQYMRVFFIITATLVTVFTAGKALAIEPTTEYDRVTAHGTKLLNQSNLNLPNSETSALQIDPVEFAFTTAVNAGIEGPHTIKLNDQATLHLPEKYIFIPRKDVMKFMDTIGKKVEPELVGFIVPSDDDLSIIRVQYVNEGHITDEEVKSEDANDRLDAMNSAIENDNNQNSIGKLSWATLPNYDVKLHQLTFSTYAIKTKNNMSQKSIISSAFVLGRTGYIQLTFPTSDDNVSHGKQDVAKIINGITFNNGKRYEDFVPGKDKVADGGFAGLMTDSSAKRLGLAVAIAFLIKLFKIGIIPFILFFKQIKNLFISKK